MLFSEFVNINPKVSLERGKEYPCVMMDEVEPGKKFVSGIIKKSFKGGSKFQKDDTLFARITPCLENGKIAKYTGQNGRFGFGSTEFFVFRAKKDISDSDYIYYLALSDILRKPAEASMFGASGRQRADLSVVKNIEIDPPPLPIQRKITGILYAYDDLIENNIRRIKILEEMAHRIYREWFVHFRYPGHENQRLVESELGMIPDGWQVKSVSEAVELNPRLSVPRETCKPFVPMSGLNPNSMLVTDYEMRTGSNGSKFQNNDTLMARITPSLEHGKTAFVQFLDSDQDVAIGSTEFIVMRSKTLHPYFVYCLTRTEDLREQAIKSMVGASGRQRVQMECFDTFFFPHPEEEVLPRFANVVEPIFSLVQNIWKKTKSLRQTRDLLLPKLISGKIDVSELDIDLGAEV